jgi:hypothetical protein
MPQLTARLATPWGLAASLWGERVATPWGLATALWSTGGAYTAPEPPEGGTPAVPSTAARFSIAAARAYVAPHSLTVLDMRDSTELEVESLSIAADLDSPFWSLTLSGAQELYTQLSQGEQPAQLRVTLDGMVWEFLVDSVTRSRAFPRRQVQVQARSFTAAAGAPFQQQQTWALEGATTAAQIAASANVLTELDVIWLLDDWPVPDGVFSFTGTTTAPRGWPMRRF